jgi:hypothetical protein
MIEQIGGFIGMLAADVRNFFRGRQAVPCTVDWRDEYPEFAELIDPDDGCGTCDTDCCISTDLPKEWKEWNQR